VFNGKLPIMPISETQETWQEIRNEPHSNNRNTLLVGV
jgi:hypothetical protein